MSTKHVSPSQLNMLAKCGQQWYFRYIEGRKMMPNARMLIGRAVDQSINANLGNKIEAGELLELGAVEEIASAAIVTEFSSGIELDQEEAAVGLRVVRDRAIDSSVSLAQLHHSDVAPDINPTHVQRRFDIEIEGYDTDLVGILDVQEGMKSVRDTKTTRKSISDKSIQADESLQLTAYALAVKVSDGETPGYVGLDYLIDKSHLRTPKPPKFVQLRSTRNEHDFQALLNRIEAFLKVTETGLVTPAPPDSWWCSASWCGYWDICPFVNSTSFAVKQ